MSKRLVRYAKRNYPAIAQGAYKRYNVYAPAVKQLASDVMYLKGLVNSEPQPFTTQSSNNVDYNGVIVSCSTVVVGDNEGNRTGNRILPRYFSLNMVLGTTSTFAGHSLTARAIVFRYWGESANAYPVLIPSEVLATIGTQFSPLSHLKTSITGPRGDRARRIEVLRNEIITFDAVGKATETIHYNLEMNGNGTSRKEHIEFIDGGTAQPISGGLFVMIITGDATGTNFYYQLESRLTFYDN